MSFEDNQLKISQILANKYIIDIDEKTFLFSEPGEHDVISSQLFYKKVYKELKKTGNFLTIEEAEELMRDQQIWTEENETKFKDLTNNLEKLSKERHLYKYRQKTLNSIDNAITVTKKELSKLAKQKNVFIDQTIEYQATFAKNTWLLSRLLRNENGHLVWNSYEEFEHDENYLECIKLVNKLFYTGIFNITEIREVAKSEPWRTLWRVALKGGSTLFPCGYLTTMQFFISHWSLMYDYGRESMDSPPSDVFENDELFDDWLEAQSQKFEDESKKKYQNNSHSLISNPKIANANEIFIAVDSVEDAQKVYNELNSSTTKSIIRKRMEVLERKGRLKEADMPDTHQDLLLKRQQMLSESIKGTRR